ncbi:hypothetical protein C8034_v005566 [Colletotrichum sidae]|uniref:Uncharacterized protein n=3 Tax=Colletotrichum orbiculare species complex TaxID=2707354 RepID=A0A4R8QXM5_COLTR|nr:hypothetical protein C8035_v009502 [Colletotrichum spinosum]TDZ39733.1 hypothetical protein CTRI78_v010484 [Colletotrichum trifolii]TEA12829.1 hypothetical protein C8034_v005566 [Colletotrichum sidae]
MTSNSSRVSSGSDFDGISQLSNRPTYETPAMARRRMEHYLASADWRPNMEHEQSNQMPPWGRHPHHG